ncbi:MAG: hypothetical protein NZM06_09780 [Chloroherpetonaceae bacterium]|nr:hypothetical protein [Chloroherpetonaceae bacterium]MDW8438691.1 hypothetical protein [Chloroherpetonaceae bacterium]
MLVLRAAIRVLTLLAIPLPLFAQLKESNIGRMFAKEETLEACGSIVDTILIVGNGHTKPFVIRQEFPFQEGDTLTLQNLTIAQQLTYNLQLFNLVNVSAKRFAPFSPVKIVSSDTILTWVYEVGQSKADELGRPYTLVFVEVYERWFIFPQPIFDLRGVSLTQWFKKPTIANVNAGIAVFHTNLTGYKDRLTLSFGAGFDPFFRLSYFTPYLWSETRLGLGMSLLWRDLNNLALDGRVGKVARYVQRTFSASISASERLSTFDFVSGSVGYTSLRVSQDVKQTYPSATVSPDGVDVFPTFSVAYAHSRLDFNQCATDGIYFSIRLVKVGLPNRSNRIDITRGQLDFRVYRKILGDLSLGFYNLSVLALNAPVPNHQRIFFGYDILLRGYTDRILEGDNLQLNSIELRYPAIPLRAAKLDFIPFERFQIFQYGLFVTAFLDAGNVWHNPRSQVFGLRQTHYDFRKNKYGYGFGLVFVGGYEATARLDFAFNQQGKFQIVIENDVSF